MGGWGASTGEGRWGDIGASFPEKVMYEPHLKGKVGASRQKRRKKLFQVKGTM